MTAGEIHRFSVPSQITSNLAHLAEMRNTDHAARRMASAPKLMTGAWVRARCLHRCLHWGSPPPSSYQQATTASEHGQSQPAPRGVRCTRSPWIWWRCHCRGKQRRPRLVWKFRTQLRMTQISRSRVLGLMLSLSAWALCPFLLRCSAQPAGAGRDADRCRGGGHSSYRCMILRD